MVGFLFAGQGSQYIGMGKDLYESFPEARTVFEKAEEILGFGIKKRMFEGPQDMLKLTSISQPAILVISIAAFEAFKSAAGSQHQVASFAAGLSLGEYTALVACGAISFEDGLRIVRKRGEIMEEAANRHPGAMAAVLDLSSEILKEICVKTGAEIANLNAPGQTVISGKVEAVTQASEMFLEAGAKRVIPLEVSGGFHSSLMFEASAELKKVLDGVSFSAPVVPIISNFTAKPEYGIPEVKENLVKQMYSSVRWEESMRFMLSQGVDKFYEFGPGKVLKGLMRRIDSNAHVVNIEKRDDILNLSN
ncbi:MAG: ACP S-malonyltransferase [Candidatus Omnitrophica bacterium]|nr:ACP S-malonyltransferase [Candidatus Omnitrophota bacterium]